MAIEAASVVIRITADDSDFQTTMTRVKNDTKGIGSSIGQSFQTAGKNVTQFGHAMKNLAAPLAGVFTFSIYKAISFESAFANVEKTVDASEEELSDLRETLRSMATDANNPLSALDNAAVTLADIAAIGGQMGIAVEDMDEFVQTVGLITVATNLSADSTAVFLGRLQALTGMDASWFDNIADALVVLGNTGATTEDEIVAVAEEIINVGTRMGLSELEILAFAAAWAELGVEPEIARTAMLKWSNSVTVAMAQGGTDLKLFADIAGVSIPEFRRLMEDDASTAFILFEEGLAKMEPSEQIAALDELELSEIRVSNALLTGADGAQMFATKLDVAFEAATRNTAAMDEAEKKADTTAGGINRLKNQMNDLGITIGETVTPEIDELAEKLGPVIEDIGKWVEENPELVMWLGAATAGMLALGVAALVLGPIIGALGTLIGAVAAGLALVLTPMALVAIGAVGAAILIAGLVFGFGNLNEKLEELIGFDLPFDDMSEDLDQNRASIVLWFAETNPLLNTALKLFEAMGGDVEELKENIDILMDADFSFENIISALQPVSNKIAELSSVIAGLAHDLLGLGGQVQGTRAAVQHGTRAPSRTPSPNTPAPQPNASGGPVTAGLATIVGEQGPELFTPTVNGNILNNSLTKSALRGTGGEGDMVINIGVVEMHGVNNPREFLRELQMQVRLSSTSQFMLKAS